MKTFFRTKKNFQSENNKLLVFKYITQFCINFCLIKSYFLACVQHKMDQLAELFASNQYRNISKTFYENKFEGNLWRPLIMAMRLYTLIMNLEM